SLTEARRSLAGLRASLLEGQDLKAALQAGVRSWTAESMIDVKVDVDAKSIRRSLPLETKQNLLRIAQEAVTNALKHAGANEIRVEVHADANKLWLKVADNGRGIGTQRSLSSQDEHFGLVGMSERAKRLGGELHLISYPEQGTEVEVMVPLR